jgi:hypothetical protein
VTATKLSYNSQEVWGIISDFQYMIVVVLAFECDVDATTGVSD